MGTADALGAEGCPCPCPTMCVEKLTLPRLTLGAALASLAPPHAVVCDVLPTAGGGGGGGAVPRPGGDAAAATAIPLRGGAPAPRDVLFDGRARAPFLGPPRGGLCRRRRRRRRRRDGGRRRQRARGRARGGEAPRHVAACRGLVPALRRGAAAAARAARGGRSWKYVRVKRATGKQKRKS